MIDETDKSSDNLVFLRFLGMLRELYLIRYDKGIATFHNVILAGVYDIKNLKLKMIQAGTHLLQDGEKRINSPWNIATDFEVDMSLSITEITSMLVDYENDEHTGMNIEEIATELRYYTGGYPFLVSKLCKTIDEKLNKDWTIAGIQDAIKSLVLEKNTLFDDIGKNIENNPDLKELLYQILIGGIKYNYNPLNQTMSLGVIFGLLAENADRNLVISNSIFELLLYNFFTTEQKIRLYGDYSNDLKNEITANGTKLNVSLLLEKFSQHYYELYNDSLADFLENECRILFITYLRPIINGKGFYHIETETRDNKRMDVIVDYGTEQFIIEMKIWRGQQSHEQAYSQLADYLDIKNKNEGYLLTFNFNKKGKPEHKWAEYNSKKIFDCTVWNGKE
jgi:hypothetical protein